MLSSPLLRSCQGWIDGVWVDADQGEQFAVTNPATGEVIAQVPAMDTSETARAIDAARRCLDEPTTLLQRRKWLRDIAKHLLDEREELGRILTLEHGKRYTEAMDDIDRAASYFSYYANHLDDLAPQELPERARQCNWSVHARPVGVVGLITPATNPLIVLARKLAAAIAAGCTAVIRPSTTTPLTSIALLHLIDARLDLPPGLINLVSGPAEPIADTLCSHPDVGAISFTGSTEVGRSLLIRSAPGLKRLTLALSGNVPFIVFDDADLEDAANQLIDNKFKANGQDCTCANRVLVHHRVLDTFTDLLRERITDMQVGDGLAPETSLGPLIDQAAQTRVQRLLEDARAQGADCINATAPAVDQDAAGCFVTPALLRDVSTDMACWREEILGPLIPLTRFSGTRQAVALANDTDSGLAAYLFTADGDRAERMLQQLRFGHIGHNAAIGATPEAPFGAMRNAGVGREGGMEGLLGFIDRQTVPRGN